MKKLTASQLSIIESLMYPETYQTIAEETKLPKGAIRDDLIQLINAGHIRTIVHNGSISAPPGAPYDSDHFEGSHFQATTLGLKALRRFRL